MPSTSFSFSQDEKRQITDLLVGSETISQFAYRATIEKVTRMNVRDERSRLNLMKRDKEALAPVVGEMVKELVAPVIKETARELVREVLEEMG